LVDRFALGARRVAIMPMRLRRRISRCTRIAVKSVATAREDSTYGKVNGAHYVPLPNASMR
jgi:hypothetical protein